MNEMMTDQEIREIEALAEAATPGPWLAPGGAIVRAPKNPGIAGSLSDAVCTAFTANRNNRDASANTAFIAASRTAVPRMAAEIRRLWAELEEVKQAKQNGRIVELPDFPQDMNDILEPLKVQSALNSEVMKLNFRKEHSPKDVSILDYTIIAALFQILKSATSDENGGQTDE